MFYLVYSARKNQDERALDQLSILHLVRNCVENIDAVDPPARVDDPPAEVPLQGSSPEGRGGCAVA